MKNILIKPTLDWIYHDFKSNRYRFIMELVAWALSIGCAAIMAGTVPNPPLMALYPAWITGCVIYAWCAWSRRSFGMLANYCLLVSIDTFGLIRLVTAG
jgi:hypothetical protein